MITSILSFLVEILIIAVVFYIVIWVLGLIGLILPAVIFKLLLAALAITVIIRLIGTLKGTTTPWLNL